MFIEGSKILLYSIVVSIIINLVLPQILLPFASPEEIKPPNGCSSSFIQTKIYVCSSITLKFQLQVV